MTSLASRRRVAEPEAEFDRLLGRADPVRAVGIEHEYAVFEAGHQLDMAKAIHQLSIDGLPIHPTNPNIYLTRLGTALMADGLVAEVAIPPVDVRAGFTGAAERWTAVGRQQLIAAAPGRIEGGSTHISVGVDPSLNNRISTIYARSFSAPTMLLMDQQTSPGLLVRPRPGRTELCGEYLTGNALRVALAFATTAVIAIELRLRTGKQTLPPYLDVVLEPARRRYGWYIDRVAFGDDLYCHGRDARLLLAGGSAVTAGEFLIRTWELLRPVARTVLSTEELRLVDGTVDGRDPLPLEGRDQFSPPITTATEPHVLGKAMASFERPGFTLLPARATWDWVVYSASNGRECAVLHIPRSHLGRFLQLLECGRLDRSVEEHLSASRQGQVLASHSQTSTPGLFDSIEAGPALLPHDRYGIGDGPVSQVRPGKVDLPPTSPPDRLTPTIGAVLGLALAIFLVGLFTVRAGGSQLPTESGLDTLLFGLEFQFEGDGMVTDVVGDNTDWYGVGEEGNPDAIAALLVPILFANEADEETRLRLLEDVCAREGSICPADLGPLARATGWVWGEVFFSDPMQPQQAGLAWADPGRPTYEGPAFDTTTGRNTSFDLFLTQDGAYGIGVTTFDGQFSQQPTDDMLALVRPDAVGLLLPNSILDGFTNPAFFVIGPGGVDMVALPEGTTATVTIGAVATTTTAGSTTTTTTIAPTPPTTVAPTVGPGADSGGTGPVFYLLIGIGILLMAVGIRFLLKTGQVAVPLITGFEKGNSG